LPKFSKLLACFFELVTSFLAYGAKLSGGGLGGIVIALCPNQELAQTIANKCHKLISNYWIEEI